LLLGNRKQNLKHIYIQISLHTPIYTSSAVWYIFACS